MQIEVIPLMRTKDGVELKFNCDTHKFETTNMDAIQAAIDEELKKGDVRSKVDALERRYWIKMYGYTIIKPS